VLCFASFEVASNATVHYLVAYFQDILVCIPWIRLTCHFSSLFSAIDYVLIVAIGETLFNNIVVLKT
jgi:hypothetical protein